MRIVTRQREEMDGRFFERKIAAARDLRTRLGFGGSFRGGVPGR